MANIIKRPYGYQLCVTHKLLPKRLWITFDDYEAAEQYGRQLESLLEQGIVPASLLEKKSSKGEIWTVHRCVAEYRRHNSVPLSDQKLLDTLLPSVATVSTSMLNYEWAEAWIRQMKRDQHLAPSTIRHRHGALARCLDWIIRKHPDIMAANPLRLLKRGFSTYTEGDAEALAKVGKLPRYDDQRDRRLHEGEEEHILEKLSDLPNERMLFQLALNTAMRLRECYTLELSVSMSGVPSRKASGPGKIDACLDTSSSPGWKAERCTATGKCRMICAIWASNAGSIAFTESCVQPACALKQVMASAASNAAVFLR